MNSMCAACEQHMNSMWAACEQHVSSMWAAYMLLTCCSHAAHMLFTCCSHAAHMLFTCCSHAVQLLRPAARPVTAPRSYMSSIRTVFVRTEKLFEQKPTSGFLYIQWFLRIFLQIWSEFGQNGHRPSLRLGPFPIPKCSEMLWIQSVFAMFGASQPMHIWPPARKTPGLRN